MACDMSGRGAVGPFISHSITWPTLQRETKKPAGAPWWTVPFPVRKLLRVAALAGEPEALRKISVHGDLSVPLLGMYPEGSVSSYGDACSSLSTVALFTIARRRMGNEDVAHKHNGILSSHKEK